RDRAIGASRRRGAGPQRTHRQSPLHVVRGSQDGKPSRSRNGRTGQDRIRRGARPAPVLASQAQERGAERGRPWWQAGLDGRRRAAVTESAMAQSTTPIDFWFSIGSLYTYLTVMRIDRVEELSDVSFRWRPFSVRAIMIEMDNRPMSKPV